MRKCTRSRVVLIQYTRPRFVVPTGLVRLNASLGDGPACTALIGMCYRVVDPDLGDDLALFHLVSSEGHNLVQIRLVQRRDEVCRRFVSGEDCSKDFFLGLILHRVDGARIPLGDAVRAQSRENAGIKQWVKASGAASRCRKVAKRVARRPLVPQLMIPVFGVRSRSCGAPAGEPNPVDEFLLRDR